MKTKNNLIAICSGTKGVGKTWFAANLCHALSLMKQKILFFDADCGLENIAAQLNLSNTKSYKELLHRSLTLNNNVVSCDKGRFDVISSPAGENFLSTFSVGRTQILARDLLYFSAYYDKVIIDCSDESLIQDHIFLNMCPNILILTNTNSSSLTAIYAKLEEIKNICPQARFSLVINHASSENEGRHVFEILAQAAEQYLNLKVNLAGLICEDSHIRDAVLNRSLLLNRYPVCKGSENLALIARNLTEELKNA